MEEIFWLKEHGIVMVEQPMPKEMLDANAWLTEQSPLPTFADEAIQRLKDIPSIKGAYTGINIKLMKCTGMREAWKMMNYARAEGMKVMIGCMNPKAGCAGSIYNLLQEPAFNHQVSLFQGVLEEECSQMLKDFFRSLRTRLKT